MSTFKKYLLINLALIFLHAGFWVIIVTGLSNGIDSAPKIEAMKAILFMASVAASPNIAIFALAFYKKDKIKENAFWAMIFFFLVIAGYFASLWKMLEAFPWEVPL